MQVFTFLIQSASKAHLSMNTLEISQAYHQNMFEFSSRYINIGIQKRNFSY